MEDNKVLRGSIDLDHNWALEVESGYDQDEGYMRYKIWADPFDEPFAEPERTYVYWSFCGAEQSEITSDQMNFFKEIYISWALDNFLTKE